MQTRPKRLPSDLLAVLLVVFVSSICLGAYIEGQEEQTVPPEPPRPPVEVVPPMRLHVPELSAYLDRVQIGRPVVYRQLAVFPVTLAGEPGPAGTWLSAQQAIARGILAVREKEAGSVPTVVVENRSRDIHVLIMTGEVISGGKQTRTVKQDVVLAPGQSVDVGVYCVERGRWSGKESFKGGDMNVPQSMQKAMRAGTTQEKVWSEVSRTNKDVGGENATDSLEAGLKTGKVQKELEAARKALVPEMPAESVGFIFVHRGRAVGAEFFGSASLARDYLPRLVDSYAVDFVVRQKEDAAEKRLNPEAAPQAARLYLEQIRRAGSVRSETPGSGAGIRTQDGGLLGEGVSLAEKLVHYGVQPAVDVTPVLRKRQTDGGEPEGER